MLAAGPAAEIVARDQDRAARIFRIVKDIARLLAQHFEGAPAQTGAADGLQPMRRDDDVGVDILHPARRGAAFDDIQLCLPSTCLISGPRVSSARPRSPA